MTFDHIILYCNESKLSLRVAIDETLPYNNIITWMVWLSTLNE